MPEAVDSCVQPAKGPISPQDKGVVPFQISVINSDEP